MKKIAVLGCTGSVGKQTLEVASLLKDELEIVGLAAHKNIDLVEEQVLIHNPKIICIFDEMAARELRKKRPSWKIVSGIEGLSEVATHPDIGSVCMSMSGTEALVPTIQAILAKKEIVLANKEIVVAGGEYLMKLAKENGVSIIPVDSEHSAIFQCLLGERLEDVRKIILTASGGPFLNFETERLRHVTAKEAARHPNWTMGVKVSIDSSTLMNKGFEVIEARWLFDIPIEKIEVIVHPESVIHSFVEFIDGSLKAQAARPSMLLPIQYALTHPHRRERFDVPFSFGKQMNLTFFEPDLKKFRCLDLAYEALRMGGTMPCALNAANEVLVERFCQGEVSWLQISEKLEQLLEKSPRTDGLDVETILEVDREMRQRAYVV